MNVTWSGKFTQQWNKWLAPLLLAGAAASLLLLQNSQNGFGTKHHGFLSSHGVTLGKNLATSEHSFFMYTHKDFHNGEVYYHGYNRFPVFPFWIIGWAMRSFEPDFARQIYVARQVMNLFLLLGMIVTFMLVSELIQNRLLAVAITLLAFSSYYMLFYNDMVFNDVPALFGYVLVLYAVVRAQKRKLGAGQIAFFALAPVSMGWQPFAVFLIWCLADFVDAVFITRSGPIKQRLVTFFKQPSFLISSIAALWGSSILAIQLLNEWRVVGGEFSELPTITSILWRLGAGSAESYGEYQMLLNWNNFLTEELRRILRLILPLGGIVELAVVYRERLTLLLAFMVAVVVFSSLRYFKELQISYKVPIIFLFAGFCWTVPMRRFAAFHDFQSIFHIGFVIIWYVTLSFYLRPRAYKMLAVVAFLVFALSVYQMNTKKGENAPAVNQVTAEFQNIYEKLPANSKIYIDGDRYDLGIGKHAVDFYLSGHYATSLPEAEYAVSKNADFEGRKLTSNSGFNLFSVHGRR